MTDDEAEALRREADRLRDQGRWRDAADAYAAFLLARPDDAGMVVQRAHCLKEMGQAEAALRLYRQAMAMRPSAAEPALQLGHALLRLERPAEAEAAFAEALARAPGEATPWRLWQATAQPPEATAQPPEAMADLLLDATPLAAALLATPDAPPPATLRPLRRLLAGCLASGTPATLCALPPEGGEEWRALPAGLFHRLDGLARTAPALPGPAWLLDWQEALALLAQALAAPPLALPPGALMLTPVAGPADPAQAAALRRARRAQGLRWLPLLFDAPLPPPGTGPQEEIQARIRWLAALPQEAVGLLLPLAPPPGLPLPPTAPVRLDAASTLNAAAELPRPLRDGRPFVLCAAPVSARHDQRFLLGAWLALQRRLGAAAVPDLVLAGPLGWGAEATLALLENAPALRPHVHLIPQPTEPVLDALFRQARFCLHHGQGPDAALADALGQARPLVLPKSCLPPGPTRPGLLPFPDGSEPALLALLEQLLTEPARLEAAEAALAAAPPPSAPIVAAELLATATRLAEAAPPLPPLPLRPGERVPVRQREAARPTPAMAVAETICAGGQWHPLEPWGVWSLPGPAHLHLALPPAFSGALRLELELQGPAQDQHMTVQAQRQPTGATPLQEILLPAHAERRIVLEVPAGEEALDIRLDCGRAVPQTPGVLVGIGLRALCVARADAVEDRLAMLESRRFLRAEPVVS